MSLDSLLQSRLILVTGKGGTGKTTLAGALAVLAAAKGRKTLCTEIDMSRPSMSSVFDIEASYNPVNVRPNLDVNNITYDGSLVHFVERMVGVRRVAKMVLSNRMMQKFMDFAPGARDMIMLSALAGFYEQYDTVVVDMPASGHAFSFLDITRSAKRLFRSGPVYKRAEEIVTILKDDETRMAFVALPEEMVVNETIETYGRMAEYGLLGDAPAVFLNRATLPSLNDSERALIARLSELDLEPLASEFVRAGRWEDNLEQATAHSEQRLKEVLAEPPLLVPPGGAGGIPREVVGDVAVHLGRQVGVTRRALAWS